MSLGIKNRLSRLFSDPSGNLFGVAVDHFAGYGDVRKGGLANLPAALAACMKAEPDSVTILPGSAKSLWEPYAGKAALILQGGMWTVDDRVSELVTQPIDAVRLGADALAVAIPVRGATEGKYLKWLTDTVREAAKYEMPVVAHVYPRHFDGGTRIVFDPEGIAWAVRCGIECGVDVIKVGYPGDLEAFTEIVGSCPVPVVAAGGPRTETLREALEQTQSALRAGAVGAVVGRNIWGNKQVTSAALAFKSVIHGLLSPEEAAAQVE